MNILVLGSGAREHALAVHVQRSQSVRKVVLAPGNALAALEVMTASVDPLNPADVVRLARAMEAHFVIVGAEAPLMAGVVDALTAAGIVALGPTQKAAQLEGSKGFAKRTMAAAGVPTPKFGIFDTVDAALQWLDENPGAYAVKADGLRAGKGVIVADDVDAAKAAVRELGAPLVIEQRLRGPELSLIALVDGTRAALFPLSRDHKRLLNGDLGKNTGGMGAFCPVKLSAFEFEAQPVMSAEALAEQLILPILKHVDYKGFLYAGVMFDEGKPYVIEYNARLGDPETQVLLDSLDGDLTEAMYCAAHGDLSQAVFPTPSVASACVVLASRGYPDKPVTGDPIMGLDKAKKVPHTRIYGAGVSSQHGHLFTAGGRVLSVVGHGATVTQAKKRAYEAVRHISFDGMVYRTDIADNEG